MTVRKRVSLIPVFIILCYQEVSICDRILYYNSREEVSICYRRMETPGGTPPEMESSARRFHPPFKLYKGKGDSILLLKRQQKPSPDLQKHQEADRKVIFQVLAHVLQGGGEMCFHRFYGYTHGFSYLAVF